MRTVTVTTNLDAPAEVIWHAVGSPAAFVHVARGMLRFPAAEGITRGFRVGDEFRGWTLLFGFIPFSKHRITIIEMGSVAMGDGTRMLRSDESGGLIRRWRHLIAVTPIAGERCRYVDEIEIEAGIFTPIVVAFAHVFYRHRQRRWRAVAPLLLASSRPGLPSRSDGLVA